MNESSELLESFCTAHARVRAERGGDGGDGAVADAPEGRTTRTAEWGSPVDRGCSALSERALRCMCWRPVGHVYLLSVRVNTYHITDGDVGEGL